MMRVYQFKNSDKGFIFFTVCALLLVNVFTINVCQAASEQDLIGNWHGTVWVNEQPVAVDMKIDSLKGAQASNKFHYGEPRACKVNPQYVAEREHEYWFVMKDGTGNVCRSKLEGGYLKLEIKNKNTVSYSVTEKNKKSTWETGTLERQ